MKDNERIKAEAVIYHKGKLQGRIEELKKIKNFILDEETNPERKDFQDVVRVTIDLINKRLKELK